MQICYDYDIQFEELEAPDVLDHVRLYGTLLRLFFCSKADQPCRPGARTPRNGGDNWWVITDLWTPCNLLCIRCTRIGALHFSVFWHVLTVDMSCCQKVRALRLFVQRTARSTWSLNFSSAQFSASVHRFRPSGFGCVVEAAAAEPHAARRPSKTIQAYTQEHAGIHKDVGSKASDRYCHFCICR